MNVKKNFNIIILSSTWIGPLVPTELKDVYQIIICTPCEELELCFITVLLFLECFSFVPAFPHFP